MIKLGLFFINTLAAFLFIAQGVAGSSEGERCIVDISLAIEIADGTVGHGTSRPAELELVAAKKHSTPWNDVVSKDAQTSLQSTLASKLKDKTYWLVYYRSRKSELGGDVAVFIDACSREVIYLYRGR